MSSGLCRLVKLNSDPQLSFRANPVSIHAETAELSARQKCRQTDRLMAFQRYIVDTVVFEKFTVECFHLKIVCDKIFLSSRVADGHVFSNKLFLKSEFCCFAH